MPPHRVVAVVQARVGSSRLPRKVLADVAGKPLLERVLDRVAAAHVDGIVVATTQHDDDDAVVALAAAHGVDVFRGSDTDVLDRTFKAATAARADIVVRVTADDPFKDPAVIDLAIRRLANDPRIAYASNTLEPSYPEGLDVECLTVDALATAWQEATLKSEREHVTPFIWTRPERFPLGSIRAEVDRSHLRWTVDYPEDLEFARAVQSHLPLDDFSMEAVLKVLAEHPEVAALAPSHERNSGYKASLEADSGLQEGAS
ncbi:MAG: glycosyltransferase family protein [Actinomycetota bacterium]|nr:glycosyltransferase family protein [Actinomycetota bacterium]